ncbi:uncharacterized protein GGS22DRAFT_60718 [Annulohypoxylon maeteangense]|uniref:uncharacterized protein n=1 Tax=Annulohypoxylon maeteangense TaxID=1927788 RepID=UPI0020086FC4|nr:uncharacterized protein GGS22DRAFT_60718 [Annulohypoxylon maeteangense]KAI0888570.1 hypothetical protein GGS22DRAFT_60718 [Annulohypoxylon maeteangense]
MSIAWECRDQADQAEIYYNHPLRTKVRHLEDENRALRRMLRKNGISWRPRSKPAHKSNGRTTRSSGMVNCRPLPHLPVEIQLRILSFAVTSPQPILDPLCNVKPEHLLVQEKVKSNQIAIHFLATCKAYYAEGTKLLWSNNSFVFTTPEALRNFAEVPLKFRRDIKDINLRIIAKFYDDEDRTRKIGRSYHPDLSKSFPLTVHTRPKENTPARRGFRAYGWYQLIDFLTALLPPYDPSQGSLSTQSAPMPKLLPSLEKLRIDFVNFGVDLHVGPPAQLHDLASHQFGCSLNELVLTGLPNDEVGERVSNELAGLLKNEGLLIDHAPIMIGYKNSIRLLTCDSVKCHYSSRVIRAAGNIDLNPYVHGDELHAHSFGLEFPPAPKDEGKPPHSFYHSCRTIWKKVPVKLGGDERKWELFDRISGQPWDEVEEEATMYDYSSIGGPDIGISCENCGEIHPGAIPPDHLIEDIFGIDL